MTDELERILKVALFTLLRYYPTFAQWDWGKPYKACHESQCPRQDENQALPEHNSTALPIDQPAQYLAYLFLLAYTSRCLMTIQFQLAHPSSARLITIYRRIQWFMLWYISQTRASWFKPPWCPAAFRLPASSTDNINSDHTKAKVKSRTPMAPFSMAFIQSTCLFSRCGNPNLRYAIRNALRHYSFSLQPTFVRN
jgi:hypothetical protein